MKRAYTEIDKLSIRVGIALRRYPIARIFVLVYMVRTALGQPKHNQGVFTGHLALLGVPGLVHLHP